MKKAKPRKGKQLSIHEVVSRASAMASQQEAKAFYEDWLAKTDSPDAHLAWFNLGVANAALGDLKAAESSYRRALAMFPNFLHARYNLGAVQELLRNYGDALATWSMLTQLPDSCPVEARKFLILALNGSGRLLEDLYQYDLAEQHLTRSLSLDPDQPAVIYHLVNQRLRQCSWPVLRPLPGVPESVMRDCASALTMFSISDDPAQQLDAARKYVRQMVKPDLPQLSDPSPYGHDRLRVGYLSSDFRQHPVSMLIVELLELHDRSRVEVYGFCWAVEDNSELRKRVLAALDHHIPIGGLTDEQAARLIRSKEIDVLVDLQGLTHGGRPTILAHRPAPCQISYLGLPGTSGMPFVDYILCDRFVLPESEQEHFTEKPLYMPEVFQVCDTKRPVGPTPSREDCGLPADAFVFCAFNTTHKFTPELFAAWMNVLRRVPGSVLWLISDHPSVERNLRAMCEKSGVSPDRLVFAKRTSYADYLARYRVADLFLDCFPFNGGTTVNDALWMGLPVLTLTGRTFASRMAGSLLHNLGLGELCAHSHAEYEELAVSLATDGPRLAALGRTLAERRETAPLFDMKAQVRKLEDLLLRAAGGQPPASAPAERPESTDPGAMALDNTASGGAMKTFLHVGCGGTGQDGTTRGFNTPQWKEIRFDIDPAAAPDIVGTMTDMAAVASMSVDAIYSSHNIEHLYYHEVPTALSEFRRVLRPDGFLVITCPDLVSVCELVAQDRLLDEAYDSPAGSITPADILYGFRPALARGNLFMAHRSGFTQKTLTEALLRAGFANVAALCNRSAFALWAVATVGAVGSDALHQLAAQHFPL